MLQQLAAAVLVASFGTSLAQHPVLPTQWTATVQEDGVGVAYESENFAGREQSASNPSAKWTNLTDGSCQRLIYARGTGPVRDRRYLFKCDAVNCCYEEDKNDGPIEYQIPNTKRSTPVESLGKQTISLFDGSSVSADTWRWNFSIPLPKVGSIEYTAWTTPDPNNATLGVLHKWEPIAMGKAYPNEYVNWTAVPPSESEAFIRTFNPPSEEQCRMRCPHAVKLGLLSEKRLTFLRQGQLSNLV